MSHWDGTGEVLATWTIYDHPLDAPNHVVVRRWSVVAGSEPIPDEHAARFDTLEAARDWLHQWHPGLYCIPRQTGDDPTILETWL